MEKWKALFFVQFELDTRTRLIKSGMIYGRDT